MKKLALCLLCFTMTLNSFAATAGSEDFIQIFDEYQYAITVDWDQKDDKKLEEITNSFYSELDQLSCGKSLDINAIQSMLETRIKDPKAIESAKLKLRLLGEKPSRNELIQFLKEEGKSMYSSGSSWNGEIDWGYTLGLGLPVVALIGYFVWFYSTHECASTRQEYRCSSSYNENGGTSSCGYYDVCTSWAKK